MILPKSLLTMIEGQGKQLEMGISNPIEEELSLGYFEIKGFIMNQTITSVNLKQYKSKKSTLPYTNFHSISNTYQLWCSYHKSSKK